MLAVARQPMNQSVAGHPVSNTNKSRRVASDFQRLLDYALQALARREHSTVELRRKLNAKVVNTKALHTEALHTEAHSEQLDHVHLDQVQVDQVHVDQVLEALLMDGSLSDERFAAEFVRSRVQKGYGPIRIRMDLLERGVPDRLAEEELTRPSEFWQELAAEVCLRKFGNLDRGESQPDPAEGSPLEDVAPAERLQIMKERKDAAQRRWNRCARFLSQRGFPADLIYRTLDGRLLD